MGELRRHGIGFHFSHSACAVALGWSAHQVQQTTVLKLLSSLRPKKRLSKYARLQLGLLRSILGFRLVVLRPKFYLSLHCLSKRITVRRLLRHVYI